MLWYAKVVLNQPLWLNARKYGLYYEGYAVLEIPVFVDGDDEYMKGIKVNKYKMAKDYVKNT